MLTAPGGDGPTADVRSTCFIQPTALPTFGVQLRIQRDCGLRVMGIVEQVPSA